MRGGKVLLLLLLLLAGFPATVPAEGERGALSLETCQKEGRIEAERKGIFGGDILSARAAVDEEKARSSLHLNLTPGARYYFGRSRAEGDIEADFGERFLDIPMNRVRKGIALDRLDAAGHRRARSISLFDHRVARAFFTALDARSRADAAEATAALAGKTKAAWKDVASDDPLVAAGREKSSAALEEIRISSETARGLFDLRRESLAELIGRDREGSWTLEEPPGFTFPDVTLDECLRWALAHRSDLREGRDEIEAVEKAIRLAGMEKWPRLQFKFGYNEFGSDSDESGELYTHMLLRVPLWDGGVSKARSQSLEVRRQGLETALAALRGEIRVGVTEAWLTLRNAYAAYRGAIGDPRPGRAFDEAKILFEGGRLPALDFERATLTIAAHRAAMAEKNRRCHEAESALLPAMEAIRVELRTSGIMGAE